MTNDRIILRGIQALGHHGVLEEERQRAQPFEVDVEIEADLNAAAHADDVEATVDYGQVIRDVVAIVEERHFDLMEALAATIANELLTSFDRIEAVTIEVRKMRPPVPAVVGSAGVCLRRARG